MYSDRYEHKQLLLFALLLLVGLACGGCAEVTLAPNLALLAQAPPYSYTDHDWARVLGDYVKDGLVDYDALSRSREPLERYYALLSVTGPARTGEQFNSRAQVTAYWINAYNALVLLAVMDRYPVPTMYDVSMPRLTRGYKFVVDGQAVTLADIEAELLKQSNGDVRTLLATSRAAMGSPPLGNEPMRARTLERQLAAAAARALDEPNVLRIDHGSGSILVWQLIIRRQQDFVEYWRTRRRVRTTYLFNVLLELASPQKRQALQSAVGYMFRPAPFDRTLNRWSPREQSPVVP